MDPNSTRMKLNLTPYAALSFLFAMSHNNEGQRVCREGNYEAAFEKHLKACEAKRRVCGIDSGDTALSLNAIGDTRLLLGQLEQAEKDLREALRVRVNLTTCPNDTASTRGNRGRCLEIQGKLMEARAVRREYKPVMICGNLQCPKLTIVPYKAMKGCAQCHCVFYCNEKCKSSDWKRHKAHCRTLERE